MIRRLIAVPEVVIFEGQSPSENLNPEELRRSTDFNNSGEGTAIVAATEAIDFAARSPAFVQARSKQLMTYLRYFDRRTLRMTSSNGTSGKIVKIISAQRHWEGIKPSNQ